MAQYTKVFKDAEFQFNTNVKKKQNGEYIHNIGIVYLEYNGQVENKMADPRSDVQLLMVYKKLKTTSNP